jgi:hypothetical protein
MDQPVVEPVRDFPLRHVRDAVQGGDCRIGKGSGFRRVHLPEADAGCEVHLDEMSYEILPTDLPWISSGVGKTRSWEARQRNVSIGKNPFILSRLSYSASSG